MLEAMLVGDAMADKSIIDSDVLRRFREERVETQRKVSAGVSGLWWRDEDTDSTGQFSVSVTYQPDEFLVYPESLTQFLRQFNDIEERPEVIARLVWAELAELLYGGHVEADKSLVVEVSVETSTQMFSVQVGEVQ